jgi:hypothetical protein
MSRIDPAYVLQQVANLKLQHPELWEEGDDQLLLDSLEGQTELNEALAAIVDRMREATSNAGGIALRMAELKARQDRFFAREQALRGLLFKLMSAAEVRKVELPEATLSLAAGKPKLLGEADPDTLPDDLCRTKREPNKTAIKQALESGRTVPGFQLSNAEPHIMIRTR